jgi:curved DNA-binding protein CbpA
MTILIADYYEILQVSRNAEADVIQAAYKRLAYKWHPDRNPGDASAAQKMRLLNEAYRVLSSPRKRRKYDFRRRQSRARARAERESPRAPARAGSDPVFAARPPESLEITAPELEAASPRWREPVLAFALALVFLAVMIAILVGSWVSMVISTSTLLLPLVVLGLLFKRLL